MYWILHFVASLGSVLGCVGLGEWFCLWVAHCVFCVLVGCLFWLLLYCMAWFPMLSGFMAIAILYCCFMVVGILLALHRGCLLGCVEWSVGLFVVVGVGVFPCGSGCGVASYKYAFAFGFGLG